MLRNMETHEAARRLLSALVLIACVSSVTPAELRFREGPGGALRFKILQLTDIHMANWATDDLTVQVRFV
jgi:hypothetical protein